MPTWILTLIENIGPLSTVAAGLVKIGEAIKTEITSSDDPAAKVDEVVSQLADASHEVTSALTVNTPHATAAQAAGAAA